MEAQGVKPQRISVKPCPISNKEFRRKKFCRRATSNYEIPCWIWIIQAATLHADHRVLTNAARKQREGAPAAETVLSRLG